MPLTFSSEQVVSGVKKIPSPPKSTQKKKKQIQLVLQISPQGIVTGTQTNNKTIQQTWGVHKPSSSPMPQNYVPGRARPCDRDNKTTCMGLQESPSHHGKTMSNMELQVSRSMQDKKTTKEQFKAWLKNIDRNGDGCISMDELRAALKGHGMSFPAWKAWWAMVHADRNHDKLIQGDQEVEELIKYAEKRWGIVVT